MIKAVLFDMDGLLIDSEPLWTRADRELLAGYGKKYTLRDKSSFMGSGAMEFVRMIKAQFSLPQSEKDLLAKRMEIFHNLVSKKLKLRPGAKKLIDELFQNGYLLGLATGNTHQLMNFIIKGLGVDGRFQVKISSDEVSRGKPAPDIFLEAARRLGVYPGQCLVLEDAVNGVVAAKAAGMRSIAVYDGRYNQPENYPMADRVVDSLEELNLKAIEDLGKA